MVNYCAVSGCGRNCANSSHLHFFGLPREKQRLEAWLEAIGRLDILDYPAVKRGKHPNHRVCSRHFAPSSIKNKHLCEDAMPTLFLSQDSTGVGANDDNDNVDNKEHIDMLCNSCQSKIQGVLYKCIVCPDFDMCIKCERFGAHNEHYMLRIPHPTKFRITNSLVTELQHILSLHQTDTIVKHCSSSDDDMPITEYKNNETSNIPNDIKNKIRNEVTRVLKLKNIETESRKVGKRKVVTGKKKEAKKLKESKGHSIVDLVGQPLEVVFAEVMDVNEGLMDVQIKEEIQPNVEGIGEQQIPQRISDELSAFILDANQYT